MNLISRRKFVLLAIIAAGCLVLVLRLLLITPETSTPDLRIAGKPQMINGAMLITLVLSNGTSRNLNIIDDGMGKPFMVLNADTNMPGTIGWGLGVLANTLRLNLAPGDALTNTVRLVDPPPRFQLMVEVRDFGAERRRAPIEICEYLLAKITSSRPKYQSSNLLARSPWIVHGIVSNVIQNAAEQMKETPTNGLRQ
jgi:hypothetical protein